MGSRKKCDVSSAASEMFCQNTFDVFIVEAEARVTVGSPPPCSGPEMGQLWFNVARKDLLICDGLTWTTLLQSEDHT